MAVFWVVPLSLVEVYRRFGGACCLHSWDGGSKHFWNVGKFLPDCMAQRPRGQPYSYSPAIKTSDLTGSWLDSTTVTRKTEFLFRLAVRSWHSYLSPEWPVAEPRSSSLQFLCLVLNYRSLLRWHCNSASYMGSHIVTYIFKVTWRSVLGIGNVEYCFRPTFMARPVNLPTQSKVKLNFDHSLSIVVF
jgi:hypothetical protein